ncbi:MAG: glycosyl hydrolase, partial [Verrucomicrobiota bacterium]
MLGAILLLGSAALGADGDLERGFLNPPDSAKPQTYWWWMNGNVTKDGITADLEAMKRVGLGGALIMEADNGGILPGAVKFMSKEWWQMTRHAISEAHRLGLELHITNCGGWAGSGGPWITPEQGMQMVVTSELAVQGPVHCSAVLPRPKVKRDYYRDIAVLAFPTPRGEADSMKARAPKITASSQDFEAAAVMDGDPKTFAALPLPPEPQRPYV